MPSIPRWRPSARLLLPDMYSYSYCLTRGGCFNSRYNKEGKGRTPKRGWWWSNCSDLNPSSHSFVPYSFRPSTFLPLLLHIEDNKRYSTAGVAHDERSEKHTDPSSMTTSPPHAFESPRWDRRSDFRGIVVWIPRRSSKPLPTTYRSPFCLVFWFFLNVFTALVASHTPRNTIRRVAALATRSWSSAARYTSLYSTPHTPHCQYRWMTALQWGTTGAIWQ